MQINKCQAVQIAIIIISSVILSYSQDTAIVLDYVMEYKMANYVKGINDTEAVMAIDTVFRRHEYNDKGILTTVVDSPKSPYQLSYTAECDTLGRFTRVVKFDIDIATNIDSLDNIDNIDYDTSRTITTYSYESDSLIRYTKKIADGEIIVNSGTIRAYGPIRRVNLPEIGRFSDRSHLHLAVKADSTKYYDEEDSLLIAFKWEYDSLGYVEYWYYHEPGDTFQIMEEYTNTYFHPNYAEGYFPSNYKGEIIYKRSAALIEPATREYHYYFDTLQVSIAQREYKKRIYSELINEPAQGYYNIRGRRIKNNRVQNSKEALPSMILLSRYKAGFRKERLINDE